MAWCHGFLVVLATLLLVIRAQKVYNNAELNIVEGVLPQPSRARSTPSKNVFVLEHVRVQTLSVNGCSEGDKSRKCNDTNQFVQRTAGRFLGAVQLLNATSAYKRSRHPTLRPRREHLDNVMHDNAVVNIDITLRSALDRSDNTEESLLNLLQHGVDESYSLKIFPPAGHSHSVDISIEASTVFGVNHAFITLEQLVNKWDCAGIVLYDLPIEIEDKPRFVHRGLLLDTSRHFIPITQLQRIIDGMSMLKLNIFHWHMIDAQSFPLHSKAAPKLVDGAYDADATYKLEDIRVLVRHAFDRGVQIIPEIDVPGHAASWGIGYPNITVDCPVRVSHDERLVEHGLDKIALNPLLDETYDVVLSLLSEVFSLFPSQYIHLGGDEVDEDCWLSNDQIKAWKQVNGNQRQWKTQLHSLFMKRISSHAKKHGKVPILWDEALDLNDLPSETVIQVWRWWLPRGTRRAQHKNYKTISSLGYYLDYADNTWEKMYDRAIPMAESTLTMGGEACSWMEHADEQSVENRIFQRLPALAERLWSNAEVRRNDRTLPRIAHSLCRMKKTKFLSVSSLFPDFCSIPQYKNYPTSDYSVPFDQKEEL